MLYNFINNLKIENGLGILIRVSFEAVVPDRVPRPFCIFKVYYA